MKMKISIIFIAIVSLLLSSFIFRSTDAVGSTPTKRQQQKTRINTKTILSESDEQLNRDLKAYQNVNEKIVEAIANWEGVNAEKIRQNNEQIDAAQRTLKQAMANEPPISNVNNAQILHELSDRVRMAQQHVDEVMTQIALAQWQKYNADAELHQAEASFAQAQQRLDVAKEAARRTSTALDEAETEQERAIAELDKKQKMQQTVHKQLDTIDQARSANELFLAEAAKNLGQNDALKSFIQEADVHYNNLYKSMRKLLLDRQIEELVKVKKELNKHKHKLDALTFRPLMDIRDRIVYLATKHFGFEEAELEAERHKCMEDGHLLLEESPPNLVQWLKQMARKPWSIITNNNSNSNNNSSSPSNRYDDQSKQKALLNSADNTKQSSASSSGQKGNKDDELLTYVARALCLYTEIGTSMTEEERQRVMLEEEKEQLAGTSNIDLVGQQLDAQVEREVRGLISDQKIIEYPRWTGGDHGAAGGQQQQQSSSLTEGNQKRAEHPSGSSTISHTTLINNGADHQQQAHNLIKKNFAQQLISNNNATTSNRANQDMITDTVGWLHDQQQQDGQKAADQTQPMRDHQTDQKQLQRQQKGKGEANQSQQKGHQTDQKQQQRSKQQTRRRKPQPSTGAAAAAAGGGGGAGADQHQSIPAVKSMAEPARSLQYHPSADLAHH